MKIGILSDTHGVLPPQVFDFFKPCDEIWHAGDIGNIEVINDLETFKPLRAVYGNIDGGEMRSFLSEYLYFRAGQLTVLLMHIGGYPPKYNGRSLELLQQYRPDIFVCGHSHILKVMYDRKRSLLYVNPGAAGNYGLHKAITFLRFDVKDQKPVNMEVYHEDRK
ncbi:MAG: metallophosphatase family protein [Bacteroidales bacterium]|jgi:putative phosphoesterase|nr:metallophosphatase family protein [Bacteroidales bacterium]